MKQLILVRKQKLSSKQVCGMTNWTVRESVVLACGKPLMCDAIYWQGINQFVQNGPYGPNWLQNGALITCLPIFLIHIGPLRLKNFVQRTFTDDNILFYVFLVQLNM